MNALIQPKQTILSALVPVALGCFALMPQARADCQQGCDTSKNNTFLGDGSLVNNTTGFGNAAIGSETLANNTTGVFNTAVGSDSLTNNTLGVDNTGIGASALTNNTTGSMNTAVGYLALLTNVTGMSNTAVGLAALTNSGANLNTAVGQAALYANTVGASNTAIGANALSLNTSGIKNIAVGVRAGVNLTTGSLNIHIGHPGVTAESNTMRIGKTGDQTNTYIAGISGVTVAGGVGVVIDTNGHLGTVTSAAHYKEAIKPMNDASDPILSLKPVTFRYKKELDPKAIPQFGLVAEDVAKVDPDLVAKDDQGKPYSVRYEAVNAMLLNEFLKEHKKVEEQARTAQEQAEKVEVQAKEIAELKTALKEVRARLDSNGL